MDSPLLGGDGELVGLALQGQSEAFGELYNRYFPSVYDFLHRMTRNAEEAADLAQETFLRAMENLGGLQDASRFKSWLFSIAHNGALNRLAGRKREVAPLSAAGSAEGDATSDPLLQQVDPDRLANPEQAAEARETASLVWEAAASLDPRTYAVLDLHVRQGLQGREIAEVLGVSRGNARIMLTRMRRSVEEAIGTFLLARRGSKDCQELQAIVAPVSIPPVTPELRRTIDRHVRKCDLCARRKKTLLTPVEAFGALAAVPVPLGLQDAIWGEIGKAWAASAGASSAGGGGAGPPAGADVSGGWGGWLGPAGLPWSVQKLAIVVGGAVALAAVSVSMVLFSPWSGSDGAPSPAPVSVADRPGVATVPPSLTVTVGQDTTFTEFNYQEAWSERHPPETDVPVPPSQREAYAQGSTARTSIHAMPGEVGKVLARVGIQFDWDLGEHEWAEVEDWPVRVTFDASYTITADWVELAGSANAGLAAPGFEQVAPDHPGLVFPGFHRATYDHVGHAVGTTGTRSGSLTKTYETTVGELPQTIYLEIHSHTGVVSWEPEASLASEGHHSSAELHFESLTIEFERPAVCDSPPCGLNRILMGDVNCDGLVNSIDAALVLQYDAALVGGSNECPSSSGRIYLPGCDMNGDGQCNSVDAALILQCEAGLLPEEDCPS